MPPKGDFKNVPAVTHLPRAGSETHGPDGICGDFRRIRGGARAARTGLRLLLATHRGLLRVLVRDGRFSPPFFHVIIGEAGMPEGRHLLKRTLIGLIRSFEQTGDRAKDPLLRSHYYKLSKEKAWEEVVSTLKKMPGYKVLHAVESVGEIVLEKRTALGRTMDITVSVIPTGPLTSAVDIYSASRGSLGDLGSNYRVILDIYRTLDKKLAAYKTESP